MSKSILDMMPPEEREKALERSKKRMERSKARKGLDISPEIFELCEFGYYFGWEALMAVRRGYTIEPVTGNKELLSMDEVQVILEGARKVWYTKLKDSASTNMVSIMSALSKTPGQTLENQLQTLSEMAKVTD